MKKTKPTNYEAAKACVSVGEEVSSEKVIEKMLGVMPIKMLQ